MKLFDQHLHSRHSFDSRAEPADNVRRAIEVGLSGLTFTEHYDTHPNERDRCVYDEEAYSATIAALRAEFGKDIWIGKGIEVCYQPANIAEIVEFLGRRRFDLVILSVHWSQGHPIHDPSAWQGRDASLVTRKYLQTVRDAMRECERLHRGQGRVFDVLGHLDFAKRYGMRFLGVNHVDDHGDVIDEILGACLAADVVPEVNTSTIRQGLGESMPGPAVIRRYAELGGTMMSLGSDSHRAGDIGADFAQAVSWLVEAGIGYAAVFKERQRRGEKLSGQN